MDEKFTRVNNCDSKPITGFNGLPIMPINVDELPGIAYIPETDKEDDDGTRISSTSTEDSIHIRSDK
jgi:hypothetical protein